MASIKIYGKFLFKLTAVSVFAIAFLHEFSRLLPDSGFLEKGVFGDDGDGFFNLWVMKHNVTYLSRGWFSEYFDGKIFFPDNSMTLLWSDINLLPSGIFAFFEALWPHPFAAFNLTVLALFCLGTLAYIFFFHAVVRISSPGLLKNQSHLAIGLILAFSFAASFSFARFHYFIHVQNFSSFWMFVILGGCLHYLTSLKKRWLTVAVLGMVAITYSSAYFTVLGGIFMLWFGVFCLLHLPLAAKKNALAQAWYIPVLGALCMAPVVIAYQGQHEKSGAYIYPPLGFSFKDLFIPKSGTPVHDWLKTFFTQLPEQSHENLAFLTVSVIIGLGILLLVNWRQVFTVAAYLTGRVWIRAFCLGLIGVLVAHKYLDKDNLVLLPHLFLTMIAALFTWFMARLALLKRENLAERGVEVPQGVLTALGFLLGCTIISYHLGAGASSYGFGPYNMTVWYLFARIAPGVHKMRAISRLGGVGHVLVLGLCCVGLSSWLQHQRARAKDFVFKRAIKSKEFAVCLLLALTVLHTFENRSSAYFNNYDASFLQLGAKDREFLQSVHTPVLAYPFSPIHKATYHMLTLLSYPNVTMLNGYSGKFTKAFDNVVAADNGRLSQKSVDNALQVGVDKVLINKKLISPGELLKLKQQWPKKVFESARLYVFDPKG